MVDSNPCPLSTLHAYKMEFVQVVIQIAKMIESLSPSESVQLINSMIAGTQAQTDLIMFNFFGEDESVVVGYWNELKKMK